MGEIIVRPLSSVPMPFTGERLTSALTGQTEIEHLHRYLLAREWCRDKDVLDVASGEGYGTALLAQVARSATGVEIAGDAVDHASASYRATNLRYVQGDARAIPLADASVDVAVSFETIEHFAEHQRFLSEVRRVLRPQGALIVSTPDRDNYSPAETAANPYHVKEMTGPEFLSLLAGYFKHVTHLVQRPVLGSVMMPTRPGDGVVPLCFERRGAEHFEASVGLARPQYLVAVCSESPLEQLPPSVYIETSRLGYLLPQDLEAQLAAARQELVAANARASPPDEIPTLREQVLAAQLSELRARALELERSLANQVAESRSLEHSNELAERACALLRRQLAECHEGIEAQQREIVHRGERVDGLQRHAEVLQGQVASLLASTSWRATRPLRFLSGAIRGHRLRGP